MTQISNEKILEELKKLRIDVDILKGKIDQDFFLTSEEEDRLDEALEEYEAGKAVSIQEIEKKRKDAQPSF